MENAILVAGIGTDVGKTVLSGIICRALNADYWKPVQAGDLDNSDSMKVKRFAPSSVIHPETFLLNTPMAPHESAHRDKIEMSLQDFVIPQTENLLVIEMAGGLMVPINEDELYIVNLFAILFTAVKIIKP